MKNSEYDYQYGDHSKTLPFHLRCVLIYNKLKAIFSSISRDQFILSKIINDFSTHTYSCISLITISYLDLSRKIISFPALSTLSLS